LGILDISGIGIRIPEYDFQLLSFQKVRITKTERDCPQSLRKLKVHLLGMGRKILCTPSALLEFENLEHYEI